MKHVASGRGVAKLLAPLGLKHWNDTFDLLLQTIIVLSQNKSLCNVSKQCVTFLICTSHMHTKYTTNTDQNTECIPSYTVQKLETMTNYVIDLQIKLIHFLGMTMMVCWSASLQLWLRLNYFNNYWMDLTIFPPVAAVFCANKLMFAP